MAARINTDGVWMRKTEEVDSTCRKNKRGKKKNKTRGKKIVPLDIDFTFESSRTPEGSVCRYDNSLVLVSVPRDGLCLFHSVLRAQGSYGWGDSSLSLDKLLQLVELEAMRNKSMYICYLDESDQANFKYLLRNYLQFGSFNSVLGDLMPSILANALNIKITIEQTSGAALSVEPSTSMSSHVNEIHVRLVEKHYEPYIKSYH